MSHFLPAEQDQKVIGGTLRLLDLVAQAHDRPSIIPLALVRWDMVCR